MIILTLFDLLILINELLYLIILGIWVLLFQYKIVESPSPLFATIISMINGIVILFYMVLFGSPFIYFIIYLIFFIMKIFSILNLIFYYKAYIDYFSILIGVLIIFIITTISSISTINSNT